VITYHYIILNTSTNTSTNILWKCLYLLLNTIAQCTLLHAITYFHMLLHTITCYYILDYILLHTKYYKYMLLPTIIYYYTLLHSKLHTINKEYFNFPGFFGVKRRRLICHSEVTAPTVLISWIVNQVIINKLINH
jgi:hypothetical protein